MNLAAAPLLSHRNLTRSLSRVLAAWAPLVALPLVAAWLSQSAPAWIMAWSLAAALYAGMKWLTFATSPAARGASAGKALQYLLLWPGMDAAPFFREPNLARPAAYEWSCAALKSGLGLLLMLVCFPILADRQPALAAWCGLIGIALALLFGLAHIVSLAWRLAGRVAPPIMNRPFAATSLGDFWCNRWNLAFRDVVRRCVFQPLVRRLDLARATLGVFLVSGLIHDLVMSLPVRAGLGKPTLYFLIQGAAVLFERSRLGMRLGLGQGLAGRAFAAAIVLLPLGLLFHEPFLEQVIVPTLRALTAEAPTQG